MPNPNLYYSLLRRPVVTEKTSMLQELRNQFCFKVSKDANKSEIKKAVETLFKVSVVKVNIINLPGKIRRTFGRQGRTSGWKKALVTLREGDVIEAS